MTPQNPLVAGRVETATPFSGSLLLEDGEQLVQAIRDGDWVAGGFAVFAGAVDTVATISDPIGSLIAAGLGWLMDHLEPLKGWMNDLTGDAGEVLGFAGTWTNIGAQLRQSADDLKTVLGDLDSADGEAIAAYRRFQQDVIEHLGGAAMWADGISAGMQMASTIVQVVHDLVRDSLSQLVGSLISYAAELVFSLGLATPLVIEQATTRIASLVGRFAKKIPELVDAIRALGKLLDKLKDLFRRLEEVTQKALRGAAHTAKENVAGLPGIRRLDPRRNELIDNMSRWANDAAIPGYKPYGDLSPTDFIDKHLKEFTPAGYPDWRWPPDNGFDGPPSPNGLNVGDRIDRIAPGGGNGRFASPPGTSFEQRALPPDRLDPDFSTNEYAVLKPLPHNVTKGLIAEGFEQTGGGVQYYFPQGIDWYLENDYLKELKGPS